MTIKSFQHYAYTRIKSIKNAIAGLFYFIKNEPHGAIHLLSALIVVCAGWYFAITGTEWILIIFAIALVWVAEVFNTALEKLADWAKPEYDKKIKTVKDLAAGSVLVAAIAALIIGIIIFFPKLID